MSVDGQRHAARHAVKQPHPQLLFQAGDTIGDGLLGQGLLRCRFLKLAGVGDGNERTDGLEVHTAKIFTTVGCASSACRLFERYGALRFDQL